ncbi:MAG: DNA polymerase I [Candidatus Krumholzibacteria bacterium]
MSLFLVDGHALAYRSYYAFIRRPLVNSKGEETSAVFGFTKTILTILEKFDPSHIAVVFDSEGPTFRHELFTDYKANRPSMPESLAEQLPKIQSVLEAMSIPFLSMPGYEADDIIATLAARMGEETPVRVVSGDKDLLQIVSDTTHVIRPGKDGLLGEEIDPERLKGMSGLDPEQFVDYQALMGDATDNVPGVRGVGEKTALKLIHEFGTLENTFDNLESIRSGALRDKLIKGKEQAYLSRQLVRLEQSVPMDISLDELARKQFDTAKLQALLKDLEFSGMLQALGPPDPEPTRDAYDYRLVDTEERLHELARTLKASDEFAIDVETSALDPMRAVLAGISVAVGEGRAWYVPVHSVIDDELSLLTSPREAPGLPPGTVKDILGPVLRDASVKKIGQNIKYDAVVLENAGFELAGISFDTMLASYCLDPGQRGHGLDYLASVVFGHKMIPFKSLFEGRSRRRDIRTVGLQRVSDYACEDADYTLRLKHHFQPLLQASQVKDLFEKVEMPLSRVLTRMEMRGVALDVPILQDLSGELSTRCKAIERSIYREAGEEFNINSTARLQEILFKKLGLKPTHKTKTGYSTDIEVLKGLSEQHVLPEMVIEYRTLSKLKNTYIDALPRLVHPATRRVHTSYNQAITTTGRLSSSSPNLQNIPIRTEVGREIRKAFVAGEEGWTLIDADYSQIELRIMAHLSRDAELVKAFEDDDDVHRRTAARVMKVAPAEVTDAMRARAKMVNFGIIYGMGARGLAQALDIEQSEARKFIDDYFENYPGVRRFIDDTIESARREKAVTTLLGRVRRVPDIDSGDRRAQAFAQRVAVNTPIQGTAADIIKVAMVTLDAELEKRRLEARMILQVHDELLLEAPEREVPEVTVLVREAMEGAMSLRVPLKVDIGLGRNWLEAHI